MENKIKRNDAPENFSEQDFWDINRKMSKNVDENATNQFIPPKTSTKNFNNETKNLSAGKKIYNDTPALNEKLLTTLANAYASALNKLTKNQGEIMENINKDFNNFQQNSSNFNNQTAKSQRENVQNNFQTTPNQQTPNLSELNNLKNALYNNQRNANLANQPYNANLESNFNNTSAPINNASSSLNQNANLRNLENQLYNANLESQLERASENGYLENNFINSSAPIYSNTPASDVPINDNNISNNINTTIIAYLSAINQQLEEILAELKTQTCIFDRQRRIRLS